MKKKKKRNFLGPSSLFSPLPLPLPPLSPIIPGAFRHFSDVHPPIEFTVPSSTVDPRCQCPTKSRLLLPDCATGVVTVSKCIKKKTKKNKTGFQQEIQDRQTENEKLGAILDTIEIDGTSIEEKIGDLKKQRVALQKEFDAKKENLSTTDL